MLENKLTTADELEVIAHLIEKIDEEIDDQVVAEINLARADPEVQMSELTTHIYADNENRI